MLDKHAQARFAPRPRSFSGSSRVLFSATLAFSFACGGDPTPEPPSKVVTNLAVTASDFASGSGTLSFLDPDTLQMQKAFDQVDPSSTVRAFDKKLYILDSTHGTLRVYDAADGFKTPKDHSIRKTSTVDAAQANPHDVFVDASSAKIYVSLYGSFGSTQIKASTALAVLDANNLSAGIASFVSLSTGPLDTDGNPEASQLVGCGSNLYVLLQDLDRNNNYKPAGSGRLAKIDLKNPTQVTYIPLAGENPTALAVYGNCTEAIVGSAGDQLGGTLTGKSGIERVDLSSGKTLGLALSDQSLGGNVSTLDATDATHVFADLSIKSGSSYANTVFFVDALAKKKGAALLGPMSYVPAVAVLGERLLVLSGGKAGTGQLRPGLYLGAATGTSLPTEPFDFGLPPSSVALVSR
ncbi:MAG TPA: hypothetical protein PKE31_12175 [Pseudomonadota bacterium]|nr:hypothetical protein [Pseudomonadota bacterium]HMU39757.1 hypothetical protein [Pseudomonadota bacterium]